MIVYQHLGSDGMWSFGDFSDFVPFLVDSRSGDYVAMAEATL